MEGSPEYRLCGLFNDYREIVKCTKKDNTEVEKRSNELCFGNRGKTKYMIIKSKENEMDADIKLMT